MLKYPRFFLSKYVDWYYIFFKIKIYSFDVKSFHCLILSRPSFFLFIWGGFRSIFTFFCLNLVSKRQQILLSDIERFSRYKFCIWVPFEPYLLCYCLLKNVLVHLNYIFKDKAVTLMIENTFRIGIACEMNWFLILGLVQMSGKLSSY